MSKEKIFNKYTRAIILVNEIENIIGKDIQSNYKFIIIQKIIDNWRENAKNE